MFAFRLVIFGHFELRWWSGFVLYCTGLNFSNLSLLLLLLLLLLGCLFLIVLFFALFTLQCRPIERLICYGQTCMHVCMAFGHTYDRQRDFCWQQWRAIWVSNFSIGIDFRKENQFFRYLKIDNLSWKISFLSYFLFFIWINFNAFISYESILIIV